MWSKRHGSSERVGRGKRGGERSVTPSRHRPSHSQRTTAAAAPRSAGQTKLALCRIPRTSFWPCPSSRPDPGDERRHQRFLLAGVWLPTRAPALGQNAAPVSVQLPHSTTASPGAHRTLRFFLDRSSVRGLSLRCPLRSCRTTAVCFRLRSRSWLSLCCSSRTCW